MKKKVAELENAELDYWVHLANGALNIKKGKSFIPMYCLDWSWSGPIIEGNEIRLSCEDNKKWWSEMRIYDDGKIAYCSSYDKAIIGIGNTPLIAAMRCYVASKFGDYVDENN